jgi:hypothetical protein
MEILTRKKKQSTFFYKYLHMRFSEVVQLVSESESEKVLDDLVALRTVLNSFGFSTKLGTTFWYNLIPYENRLFSPIFLKVETLNLKRITYTIRFQKYADYIDNSDIQLGAKASRNYKDYKGYKGVNSSAAYFPQEQPESAPLVKRVITDLAKLSPGFAFINEKDYLEEDIRTAMYRIEELNEKCKDYLKVFEYTDTEEQQDITNI